METNNSLPNFVPKLFRADLLTASNKASILVCEHCFYNFIKPERVGYVLLLEDRVNMATTNGVASNPNTDANSDGKPSNSGY